MLELAQFPVQDVQFGRSTAYQAGTLTVDAAELSALLAADPRLARVGVHLARPGEATRVIHVVDVVEPRIKMTGGQDYFPGLLTELWPAGQGRTHVLAGAAVVAAAEVPGTEEAIIDMIGPGARFGRFSTTQNVVLVPEPAAGVSTEDFVRAVLRMKLVAAVHLARCTVGLVPVAVTECAAPPLLQLRADQHRDLPRVVYICYLQSRGFGRERLFYGRSTAGLTPTLVHANEVLDGAIVYNGHDSPCKSVTYNHLNNGVLRALYARHGQDLLLSGVILANHHSTLEDKERTALLAARLAKQVLGADGVIISKDGGGQGDVDAMLCCTRCGELGLPMALVLKEESGAEGTFPLAMDSPHADAIVSTGITTEMVTLPVRMDRVLGGAVLYDGQDPAGDQIQINASKLAGSEDLTGGHRMTSMVI